MLRRLESGVVAARAQFVLVVLIATIVLALADAGNGRLAALAVSVGDPAALKWILLAASAVSATAFRRSLSRTARRLSQETERAVPGRPKRMRMDLMLTLRVATGAMAILTITPPPEALLRLLGPVLDPDTAALAWAGAMSVGVAYFGSGASAARRALQG